MNAPHRHVPADQSGPAGQRTPAVTPVLSLIAPLPDALVEKPEPELPDSTSTALGAAIAEEIAILTRVLLGDGTPLEPVRRADLPTGPVAPAVEPVLELVPVFEPVAPVAPVIDPAVEALVDPVRVEQVVEQEEPAFVAPPIVEVEPLVELDPEPVPTRRPELLDELAFLDE